MILIKLESTTTAHDGRLDTLETDNTSDKSRITTLESTTKAHDGRLDTLESTAAHDGSRNRQYNR